MKTRRYRPDELRPLLKRDHTLNGGILYGIDGFIIELQGRAVEVLRKPVGWNAAVSITGMATGAVTEALSRTRGAFAEHEIPDATFSLLCRLSVAQPIALERAYDRKS